MTNFYKIILLKRGWENESFEEKEKLEKRLLVAQKKWRNIKLTKLGETSLYKLEL